MVKKYLYNDSEVFVGFSGDIVPVFRSMFKAQSVSHLVYQWDTLPVFTPGKVYGIEVDYSNSNFVVFSVLSEHVVASMLLTGELRQV